jgi:cation:H+ antiporter
VLNWVNFGLTTNLLLFAAAAVAVWLLGSRLTGVVDGITTRTGIGQAFAGMLLLGGITSLPEVAAIVAAASHGNAAIATNNLLGSASINVLLIAAADAVIGKDAITSRVATPATLLQGTLNVIVMGILAFAILAGEVAVFGIGLWSMGVLILSVASFWLASRYAARAPWHVRPSVDVEEAEKKDRAKFSLTRLAARTVFLGLGILIAGTVLATSADALAEITGIGSAMIGLVLVALATSLPELSTITAAVKRKRYEMALGDVFGTNLLTMALIFVADVAYREGAILSEAGGFEVAASLLAGIVTGIFIVGLLERRDRTILRMGYDSLAAIAVFFGGLVLLYFMQD